MLAAFFGWTGGAIAMRSGVPQNSSPELLINQDAGFLTGHPCLEGRHERIVDYLLRGGYLRRLFRGQSALPAEHFRLERASMIERQDIERLVKPNSFHEFSLYFR